MEKPYIEKFKYLRSEYYSNLDVNNYDDILDNPPPYHYSSLYSNSGVVLHYWLGVGFFGENGSKNRPKILKIF